MIGIIGYGFVGQAVANGFTCSKAIFDPKYNESTIDDLLELNPEAVFVCVPTPTDGSNFKILTTVLDELKEKEYPGLVIVKSTVMPNVIAEYDVVFNPEFLSRASANQDFIEPPMLILGGNRAAEAKELYEKFSRVRTDHIFLTDIKTAALTKYVMNSFYATKLTFMNAMFDISNEVGANYEDMISMLAKHPWMGTHHFYVPGPDGKRGFGGPCLPKDTEALAIEYDVSLLETVINLNNQYRK